MTTTKSTYIVTDPCYIMSDAQYDKYLKDTDGEVYHVEPYTVEGLGVVIQGAHVDEIDLKVGKNKEIMSDSGLTALIKLDDGFELNENHGTAVTTKEDVATNWFLKARDLVTQW